MYIPKGLKKRGEGPGAILVGGSSLMSLVFGAAAFGWIGVGVGVAGLVLLLFAEIYREASELSKESGALKKELQVAESQARSAKEAESRNDELKRTVDELRRESRQPMLGPGQLLIGIKLYLEQIRIVRKHRLLRNQVKDALVTELDMAGDKAAVSAMCPEGADRLDKQPVALIDAQTQQPYGSGLVVSTASQDVRALFDLAELPTDLGDDLRENGSFSPQGYVLRLLGLCFEGYRQLDDQTLEDADGALTKARETLTATLLPQAGQDPTELLRELEVGFSADDSVSVAIESEQEITRLTDGRGGGS